MVDAGKDAPDPTQAREKLARLRKEQIGSKEWTPEKAAELRQLADFIEGNPDLTPDHRAALHRQGTATLDNPLTPKEKKLIIDANNPKNK